MKKILSVLPVALIITALMAFGGETMAQQQGATDKAKKEVKQAKQKGKDQVKEAEDAVQKEQEKTREAVQKQEEKAREAAKDEEEGAREAEREGKGNRGRGNAYGRNKGGLEGRDFGQARAEDARMKNQEKKSELDRKVFDGEQKTVQARERIRVAREDLEKQKASRKVSDKDYELKKEKIDNAEKAVNDLEEKIKKGKSIPGGI